MAGFRSLEIYQKALTLAIAVHEMSMSLPKHELHETGGQIRRAAKSVVANIAEGYGRRQYAQEHLRFLTFALASCDEVRAHLDILRGTKSISDEQFEALEEGFDHLGRMINRFHQGVRRQHLQSADSE